MYWLQVHKCVVANMELKTNWVHELSHELSEKIVQEKVHELSQRNFWKKKWNSWTFTKFMNRRENSWGSWTSWTSWILVQFMNRFMNCTHEQKFMRQFMNFFWKFMRFMNEFMRFMNYKKSSCSSSTEFMNQSSWGSWIFKKSSWTSWTSSWTSWTYHKVHEVHESVFELQHSTALSHQVTVFLPANFDTFS